MKGECFSVRKNKRTPLTDNYYFLLLMGMASSHDKVNAKLRNWDLKITLSLISCCQHGNQSCDKARTFLLPGVVLI